MEPWLLLTHNGVAYDDGSGAKPYMMSSSEVKFDFVILIMVTSISSGLVSDCLVMVAFVREVGEERSISPHLFLCQNFLMFS